MAGKRDWFHKKAMAEIWPSVAVVAMLAVACYGLVHLEADYLWKAQELDLFLSTPQFLEQQMTASGWLLTWLGSFLTTFFQEPELGACLLVGCWLLLTLVLWRAFLIPAEWACVLLVPIAAILVTVVGLGYWIYYLPMHGHFFAATIGTLLASGSVWLFRCLSSRHCLRPVYIIVSTAVLYPLVGWYGLLAAVLSGIMAWRMPDMSMACRALSTGAALLSVAGCPLVYYHALYCQASIQDIYWTGLPVFFQGDYHPAYLMPYAMLAVTLCVMAATSQTARRQSAVSPAVRTCSQALLLAALVLTVWHCWYRDYNFHKELSMQRHLEQLDWEGMVKDAARQEEEPTRAIVMMRNLALFQLGRQGDEMYRYRRGNKPYATDLPKPLAAMLAPCLYFHYGQLNYCDRWCMEAAMETGWRTVHLKYLVRSALANGEEQAAKKYIDLLKRSVSHRQWAERYERLLRDRGALLADKEFAPVLHLGKSDDMLGNDYARIELFLMHQFAYHDSNDSLFNEQAVMSAMWARQPQLFWPHLLRYAASHRDRHIPVHFQEAALLFGQFPSGPDISRMTFDGKVVNDYEGFMQLMQRYDGISLERMRQVLSPRFGHTYYYEYYMTPDPNQY